MIGDPNLKEPPGFAALKASTAPGMASWGGEGPPGTKCRECVHWQTEGWYSWSHELRGALKPARCELAARKLGRDCPKIPPHQPSCKHFDRNVEAPPLSRLGK
jgi:hypothetical protein